MKPLTVLPFSLNVCLQHNVHVQLTDLQPGESVLVLEYAGFEGPVHDPRVTVRHGPNSDVHASLHVTLCPYRCVPQWYICAMGPVGRTHLDRWNAWWCLVRRAKRITSTRVHLFTLIVMNGTC